jgi:hypothetical protein
MPTPAPMTTTSAIHVFHVIALLLSAELSRTPRRRLYRERPTARTFRGAASQIASADTTEPAIAIQKAGV